MGFNGYLIKLGGSNGQPFPTKLIAVSSYKATPNQRMESKATRSVTGVLYRTTVSHVATKIEFTTTMLTNQDVSAVNHLLAAHFIDPLQRKILIEFYDEENDAYREATCYMPDVEYTIDHIDTDKNIVYYDGIRYAFIEY